MKMYLGRRSTDGDAYVYVNNGKRNKPLPPRNDLRNHSPDGFEWGYGGSGPAQLSLAILADAVGDEIAIKCYQAFKWSFVALITRNSKEWSISEEEVLSWLKGFKG